MNSNEPTKRVLAALLILGVIWCLPASAQTEEEVFELEKYDNRTLNLFVYVLLAAGGVLTWTVLSHRFRTWLEGEAPARRPREAYNAFCVRMAAYVAFALAAAGFVNLVNLKKVFLS